MEHINISPDFEAIAKQWCPGESVWTLDAREHYKAGMKYVFTTHVEPLQAENQKLREQLKEIFDTAKHDADYFNDSERGVQIGRAFQANKILSLLYKYPELLKTKTNP